MFWSAGSFKLSEYCGIYLVRAGDLKYKKSVPQNYFVLLWKHNYILKALNLFITSNKNCWFSLLITAHLITPLPHPPADNPERIIQHWSPSTDHPALVIQHWSTIWSLLPPPADHPAGGKDAGAEQRPAVQEGGGPQVHCRVQFPCHPLVHKWALLHEALGRLA